jgi:hypothetical protein
MEETIKQLRYKKEQEAARFKEEINKAFQGIREREEQKERQHAAELERILIRPHHG